MPQNSTAHKIVHKRERPAAGRKFPEIFMNSPCLKQKMQIEP
jgi:hypothetical protein